MSINSSSCHNASYPCSSNHSTLTCSKESSIILFVYATTNILLLLPLSVLVLYVGFQRWRLQRSSSTTATSSADIFTYHMVTIEGFGLLGCGFHIYDNIMENEQISLFGYCVFSLIIPGQTHFHCLTCVEHYLAVVHPITYLGLKRRNGVRIRNVIIGCIWLLCVPWIGFMYIYYPLIPIAPFFSLLAISLFVSSFCSLSVLHALTRPLPGDRSRDKNKVDQSKQRAFHTVTAIMGVLLLRFIALLICMIVYRSLIDVSGDSCVVLRTGLLFCLPSSLLLPLLFLHRAGKLTCRRQSTESR